MCVRVCVRACVCVCVCVRACACAAVPEVVVRPEAQEVLLHSILTLRCQATGIPQPTILWLFNGSLASDLHRTETPVHVHTHTYQYIQHTYTHI